MLSITGRLSLLGQVTFSDLGSTGTIYDVDQAILTRIKVGLNGCFTYYMTSGTLPVTATIPVGDGAYSFQLEAINPLNDEVVGRSKVLYEPFVWQAEKRLQQAQYQHLVEGGKPYNRQEMLLDHALGAYFSNNPLEFTQSLQRP